MKLSKLKTGRGLSFYLEILDEDNRKLEKWRNMLKDLPKVIGNIDEKYNLGIISNYNKPKEKDDFGWAK